MNPNNQESPIVQKERLDKQALLGISDERLLEVYLLASMNSGGIVTDEKTIMKEEILRRMHVRNG